MCKNICESLGVKWEAHIQYGCVVRLNLKERVKYLFVRDLSLDKVVYTSFLLSNYVNSLECFRLR